MLSALALAAALYTAKPGDASAAVPQHYNTSWEAVYDHNQSTIAAQNLISGGQKLGAQTATTESSSSSNDGQNAPVSSGSGFDSSDLADIPGVPHWFAACVAYRESTDDTNPAADGNAYGIIPASGYNVSGDSIAQQKLVFKQIYDTTGPSAWAADGCPSL